VTACPVPVDGTKKAPATVIRTKLEMTKKAVINKTIRSTGCSTMDTLVVFAPDWITPAASRTGVVVAVMIGAFIVPPLYSGTPG
jgi:hypothetical protein